MKSKKPKIFITGGAGFVGTNLALRLLKEGQYVLIICDDFSRRGSRFNFERLREKHKDLKLYEAEIGDVPVLVGKELPDLIYHFAAQVGVTSSVKNPINDFRINAEGTFNIARIAHLHDIPVIYSSTNKVYGDNVNAVAIRELKTRYDFKEPLAGRGISETFPIDAKHHTPYGCSKLVGELYVREYGGVVNRFSCMYGPNQHGISDQGWISFFILKKLSGQPVTIFGDGKQLRDALHADDVVRLLEIQGKMLLSDTREKIAGEVFTIGGGHKNTISVLELCHLLETPYVFEDWRPADQKVFYADIAKARKVLGWEPKVPVEKGIKDLLEWTGSHPHLSEVLSHFT